MTNMANDLTPGQDYAVKFLTSKGFKLTSSPIQLKREEIGYTSVVKQYGRVKRQSDPLIWDIPTLISL